MLIAGVSLYVGEGAKGRNELNFTNCDPRVLKLWIRFLNEVCNVAPRQLKALIAYYEDLDYSTLLEFWSSELGIPKENFDRPQLKRGKLARGLPHGRQSSYGTIHVKFYDSRLAARMRQWMDDLVEGRL